MRIKSSAGSRRRTERCPARADAWVIGLRQRGASGIQRSRQTVPSTCSRADPEVRETRPWTARSCDSRIEALHRLHKAGSEQRHQHLLDAVQAAKDATVAGAEHSALASE